MAKDKAQPASAMPVEVKTLSGAVIKICGCSHSYQDAKYGRGNRVHSITQKTYKCRCSVCGTEH